MKFNKALIVASTSFLCFPSLFDPIVSTSIPVYAIENSVELSKEPEILDKLDSITEKKAPTFSFKESQETHMAGKQFHLAIHASQEVSEFVVDLPKGVSILKDQQSDDIQFTNIDEKQWQVKADSPQVTFSIPLMIEEAGEYEVAIGESKTMLHIQIEEDQQTTEPETIFSKEKELENTEKLNEEDESNANQEIDIAEDLLDFREKLGNEFNPQEYTSHVDLLNNVFERIQLNNNNKVIVDINNLQNHFNFIGNAKNDGFGQVTLTEEINFQSGAITLKEKMLSGYPMRIIGTVNTGSRSNVGLGSNQGGDGIGFGFHTDDLDSVGETGQGMGLAGLRESFGFKIDTYRNSQETSLVEADPAWIDWSSDSAFGSFIYTDADTRILRNYQGSEAPPRVTTNPSGNSFRPFSLVYNPGVDNKILSISYEGRVWRTDVSKWIDSDNLAFIISAATGGSINLHQIRFNRFEYVTEPSNLDFIEGDRLDFLNHFDLIGNAKYDEITGILTLTEDLNNEVSNVLLKNKLSNRHPFEFRGRVNIGNGNGGQNGSGSVLPGSNGGDGIGFGFHQSDTKELGQSGQGMGIAGLENAWGFKLDTYHNRVDSGNTTADLYDFRSTGVWPFISHNPHASFIYTRDDGMLTSYDGSNNDSSSAKSIIKNNDNLFRDFKLTYNPGEYDSILSIEYDGQIWHHDVSSWLSSEDVTALSFIISAATGSQTNLQQIEVISFKYVVGEGSVNVEYKDIESGEDILPAETYHGNIGDSIFINQKNENEDEPYLQGYDFVKINDESTSLIDENGYYIFSDEEKTITNYFKRATSPVTIRNIAIPEETILSDQKFDLPVNSSKEFYPKEFHGYQFSHIEKNSEEIHDAESISVDVTRDTAININFIYKIENSIIRPVDPLDPEIEVDPENKPELPEYQGQLSIDFISSFNFGSQVISVHDQTYYAQSQRLLNEDGTVNETEERPNYVQISDRRPENERNGWELAVTQKEQFKGKENQVLNGASISLSNQQVVTAQGGIAPGPQSVPCNLVPGNRRTLLKAQGNEGMGTWIYRFGNAETADKSIALNVPRGANPEATRYSTTLIWELSAVPDN